MLFLVWHMQPYTIYLFWEMVLSYIPCSTSIHHTSVHMPVTYANLAVCHTTRLFKSTCIRVYGVDLLSMPMSDDQYRIKAYCVLSVDDILLP